MTTITDEAIEEACDGFYTEPRGLTRWAKLVEVSPDIADRYRVAMSRALTAALPHIEAAIRASIAGVIEKLREEALLSPDVDDPERSDENAGRYFAYAHAARIARGADQ